MINDPSDNISDKLYLVGKDISQMYDYLTLEREDVSGRKSSSFFIGGKLGQVAPTFKFFADRILPTFQRPINLIAALTDIIRKVKMSAEIEQSKKTLLRVAMDGIVYWLDNQTGDCYTYSDRPAKIGKAIKDADDPKTLHIELRSDWKEVMERELKKTNP